jgi:hypothetical protein
MIVGALTQHKMDVFNVQIAPCTGLWILTSARMNHHGNALRSALRVQYLCRQRNINFNRITES